MSRSRPEVEIVLEGLQMWQDGFVRPCLATGRGPRVIVLLSGSGELRPVDGTRASNDPAPGDREREVVAKVPHERPAVRTARQP
jgi:hypothetical protein